MAISVKTIPAPSVWNETLDLLLSHRSVRAYLPDVLPAGTLEALVAAAQSAASSSNLQAWSLIAVEEPERKSRLAALAGNQKHIEEAPLLLVDWLISTGSPRLPRQTSNRVRNAASMNSCHVLKDALHQLGFGLK